MSVALRSEASGAHPAVPPGPLEALDTLDAEPEVGLPDDDTHAALAAPPLPTAPLPTAPLPADAELAHWILRVADRDERALAALYDATAPRVLAAIRRVLRHDALAEEALEDTYWQVWRQAPRFDAERGAPMAWLMTIARSRAIDHHRRDSRHAHEMLDEAARTCGADEAPSCAADTLEATRRQQQLRAALHHLDAQPRQLVALAFYRGYTHDEIAAHTGLPLGTVKSQIRRALIQLRQWLDATTLAAWMAPMPEECP